MREENISSRRKAMRAGSTAGLSWAGDSDRDVYADLVDRAHHNDRPLDLSDYAERLARYDSPFVDSPGSYAGVPQRWVAVYDAALERTYRKAIRARVAEIEAE